MKSVHVLILRLITLESSYTFDEFYETNKYHLNITFRYLVIQFKHISKLQKEVSVFIPFSYEF